MVIQIMYMIIKTAIMMCFVYIVGCFIKSVTKKEKYIRVLKNPDNISWIIILGIARFLVHLILILLKIEN